MPPWQKGTIRAELLSSKDALWRWLYVPLATEISEVEIKKMRRKASATSSAEKKNVHLAQALCPQSHLRARRAVISYSARGDWVHAAKSAIQIFDIMLLSYLVFLFIWFTCSMGKCDESRQSEKPVRTPVNTVGAERELRICRTESLGLPLRTEEPVWSACPWCLGAFSTGWCPSKPEVCLYVIFYPLLP